MLPYRSLAYKDVPHVLHCLFLSQDDGVAATFGKKRQALQALESGVVLMDQSHWGRLRVAGEDRIALLHNQSTADFKALRPGQGTDTVRPGGRGRILTCCGLGPRVWGPVPSELSELRGWLESQGTDTVRPKAEGWGLRPGGWRLGLALCACKGRQPPA